MKNIYEAASENKRKSVIIFVAFLVFFTLVVYVLSKAITLYIGSNLGGLGLMGIALIVSGITSFVSYYASDKIVLSISRARPASKEKEFDYFTTVENLCLGAGMNVPKLYVIEDTATNAFATGRNPENSVICATTGLLSKLNRSELEAVFAHELSHIRNYDTLLMTIVAVLVGTIALIGDLFLRISFRGKRSNKKSSQTDAIFLAVGFLFALLSPIISRLIQLAISRRREFTADASAISITRQPSSLISALKIISSDQEPLEAANKATAHLYIENPFKNKTKSAVSWFSALFNTHPPLRNRLKALQQMV